jgi:hypothetical protein
MGLHYSWSLAMGLGVEVLLADTGLYFENHLKNNLARKVASQVEQAWFISCFPEIRLDHNMGSMFYMLTI